MRIIGIFFALFFIVLAGCQTLSKEECVAADWRVVGEQDGAAGHPPQQRFGDHAKACERAGVVPNQSLWNEGYQVGIRRFCTPLSGLAHGQKGGSYANTCPADLAPGFQSGYQVGLKQHSKQSEMNTIKSNIRGAESVIASTRQQISEGKIDQSSGESIIRSNERKINDLNRELGRREAEFYRIQNEIEDFRLNQQFGNLGQPLSN